MSRGYKHKSFSAQCVKRWQGNSILDEMKTIQTKGKRQISYSPGGKYEDYSLLGYNAV
jgi:hypothetical protein